MLAFLPAAIGAQMTITGRVLAGDGPARGASVRIPEIGVSTRTSAEGRYNIIVRTMQVRGQPATIVVRYRSASQTVPIVLSGGSLERDFAFASGQPAAPDTLQHGAMTVARTPASRIIDSTAFDGAAGPLDVATALAGRLPGLRVTGAGGPGSSSMMVFRGARSISGRTQPLVVLDGVVIDNTGAASASQRFGLGGFDYGTPLQAVALDDIASVVLLNPASAVPLYGSRAANGVLIIATKKAGSDHELAISATQRFSGESPTRLPSFQNRYGQGLGGQFEFFDGRGGGVNDSVAQSWGPLLDGQPLAQASLTEPRRPDVRFWLPQPSDVRDYFEAGYTIDVHSAVVGSRGMTLGRAAVHARDARGITPNAISQRLGVSVGGSAQPTARLHGEATLQVAGTRNEDRPGTGFDEINPVAGFTRMGRQVDFDTLRTSIMSGTEQISWIYTDRNNPFFQTDRNSNNDTRRAIIGGGQARYQMAQTLSGTLEVRINDARDERVASVADGWIGTYPTALGRRTYTSGGSERQDVAFTERLVRLSFASTSRVIRGFDVGATAGADHRSTRYSIATEVTDTSVTSARASSRTSARSLYVAGNASRQALLVDGGVRVEQSSTYPSSLSFAVFPSLSIGYDVGRAVPAIGSRVGTARARGSWWRAGSEISPRTLQEIYAGGGTNADPTIGVADSTAIPERTTGLELALEMASKGNRVGLDFTYYRERSRELVTGAPVLAQTAELSNRGLEAHMRVAPLGTQGFGGLEWDISASLSANKNRVEQLAPGVAEVPLGPSLWGASLVARPGEPVGVIVGRRYLRDSASNKLVLVNGLPVADGRELRVLGSAHPDWATSVNNTFRYGAVEAGLLVDGRHGGRIFSATNLWGSYAGTLESTAADRETGVTLVGIDSATGAPNTINRSVEDYFHSLAAIHEAWVFDASYWKLREARITYSLSLQFLPRLRDYTLRASLVGRNLLTSAKVPNIDPETLLSGGAFQGFEMGQLPSTRSVGLRIDVTP